MKVPDAQLVTARSPGQSLQFRTDAIGRSEIVQEVHRKWYRPGLHRHRTHLFEVAGREEYLLRKSLHSRKGVRFALPALQLAFPAIFPEFVWEWRTSDRDSNWKTPLSE